MGSNILPFNIIGIAFIVRIPFLKASKKIMSLYFKPLGNYSIAPSKAKTLQKYDFALAIEPTISKFCLYVKKYLTLCLLEQFQNTMDKKLREKYSSKYLYKNK